MKPYYEDASVTIYHGDCREVLPGLGPVESCITDPPYGLEFMGKGWDRGVPGVEFWRLIRGALLPGAACLAFGGTRTHHRLMVAIEDAGFEIRDCLMWLYGSGFPKSLDISKAIDKAAGVAIETRGHFRFTRADDAVTPGAFRTNEERNNPGSRKRPATTADASDWGGWGTALKPAWEPIVLAMNPIKGTFAENALQHGVAGLNVDGARLETAAESFADSREDKIQRNSYGKYGTADYDGSKGRWPANVALDEEAAAMLDEQSGERESGTRAAGVRTGLGYHGANGDGGPPIAGSRGGASRFFYTAKASRSDREDHNDHPTVKPSDLMKWLCALTKTPTGGTVLDPFMGSGTTLYAAKETGRKAIGIEIEERYCEIAAERCRQEVLAL